jgi:hypothetical protein
MDISRPLTSYADLEETDYTSHTGVDQANVNMNREDGVEQEFEQDEEWEDEEDEDMEVDIPIISSSSRNMNSGPAWDESSFLRVWKAAIEEFRVSKNSHFYRKRFLILFTDLSSEPREIFLD